MLKLLKSLLWLGRWGILVEVAVLLTTAGFALALGKGGTAAFHFVIWFASLILAGPEFWERGWYRAIRTLPVSHANAANGKWTLAVPMTGAFAALSCVVMFLLSIVAGEPVEATPGDLPGMGLSCVALAGTTAYLCGLPRRWARANPTVRRVWNALGCMMMLGLVLLVWPPRPDNLGFVPTLGIASLPLMLLMGLGPSGVPTLVALAGIVLAGPLTFYENPFIGYPAIALGCALTWRGYANRAWLVPDLLEEKKKPKEFWLWAPRTRRFRDRRVTMVMFWGSMLALSSAPAVALFALLLCQARDTVEWARVLMFLGMVTQWMLLFSLVAPFFGTMYPPRIARMLPGSALGYALKFAGTPAVLFSLGAMMAAACALVVQPWVAPLAAAVLAYNGGLACLGMGMSLRGKPVVRVFAVLLLFMFGLLGGMLLLLDLEAPPQAFPVVACFAVGVLGLLGGFGLTYHAVTQTFVAYRMEAGNAGWGVGN